MWYKAQRQDVRNVPGLLISKLSSYEKDGVPTIMSLPRDVNKDLIGSLGVANNVYVLECMKRVSPCTDVLEHGCFPHLSSFSQPTPSANVFLLYSFSDRFRCNQCRLTMDVS